jgi:quercetin 2,3-dioxygenase
MTNPVTRVFELGFPWAMRDPFLFCAHHRDAYPAGDGTFGPATALTGRNLGQDFSGKDGWSMYHGRHVPGFPQHPHRGFETVTIVRRGLIDHSDSLGAVARFGSGDVQWLTAGAGIVHSEMFPLLDRHGPNPLELFQIWLNLPSADKLVAPHFAMLWADEIPRVRLSGQGAALAEVTVVAGRIDANHREPPPPPPHSWAARPDTDVAIWCIRMEPGAAGVLPAAHHPAAQRTLYFHTGAGLRAGDHLQARPAGLELRADQPVTLQAGQEACDLVLLQGRPIGETVAQYGPFVMNTRAEIQEAFADYRRTQFGGWPWPADDPVHGPRPERFARHADGRVEQRGA